MKPQFSTILGSSGVTKDGYFKVAKPKGETNMFLTKSNKKPIIPTTPLTPEEVDYVKADEKATMEMYEAFSKKETEDDMHHKKLLEICDSYSEDEVIIACSVFARKFPGVMYDSLAKEHKNMTVIIQGFNDLNREYLGKMGGMIDRA